jgi:Xaa-Pro dipeptidase
MMNNYAARLAAARQIAGVDAIALVPGWNLVYFTGLHMHLQVRPTILFITPTGLSMIVPRLELQTLVQRPDLNIQPFAWGDSEGFVGAFRAAVDMLQLHGKTLGIDGMTMRATEMIRLEAVARDMRIVPVERELIRIRSIKGADEVASMRKAVHIAESALSDLLSEIEPGMSEGQIGTRLSMLMAQHGGEGEPFAPAVQTGPNSANPHAPAGDRKLQRDEFLLIDFGCRVNGYPSDITRTFCLGTPSAEMQHIYDTVLRANEAAQEAAKPGVAMGAVDAAARAVITDAGYGDYFTHRTGHGLGLDIHEPIPQIAGGVEDLLEPGMAFTIEPGIYVPGLGGVRIEDNVVVTQGGIDVLTRYERKLMLTR